MTPQELQSLRNLGNECERAADAIVALQARVEELEAERDEFYMRYRMDADTLSKAAIVRAERAEAEPAAARATIDTMQGGYDREAAMIIGLRYQLAAALENVKDYKENSALFLRQRDEARTELAAARARVAELERDLNRALAIAPSNAIAWQDRAIGAEMERDQYRHERDAYREAMAKMNAPAIALAALQPPPPIIMPARDWELHQQIQTLNERIAYLEPILIAARNLVDNAEEYECDGLGLFAQHGWWEPLHDALDPDGSEAADDIRQPIATAK